MSTYLSMLSTVPVAASDRLWTVSGVFIAAAVIVTIWHMVNPKIQLSIGVLCLCVAALIQVLPKD